MKSFEAAGFQLESWTEAFNDQHQVPFLGARRRVAHLGHKLDAAADDRLEPPRLPEEEQTLTQMTILLPQLNWTGMCSAF